MPSFPEIDAAVEVTDSGQSHTLLHGDTFNPETSWVVRVTDKLYFIYDTDDTHTWIRTLDLNSYGFSPAVLVASSSFNYSYHGRPSIARDGSGNLHTLVQNAAAYNGTYTNAYTVGPTWRRVPALTGISGATPDDVILPSRILNSSANFTTQAPLIWDITHAYDWMNGTCYLVGEATKLTPMEGRANNGSSRTFHRISSAGDVDGPYTITETPTTAPTAQEVEDAGGDSGDFNDGYLFTKGEIRLTLDAVGNSTLHLVWQVRNTFEYPASTHTAVEWNYNLYYARSTDGGTTWTPMDESCEVGLATTIGAEHPHITYNDSRFLIYTGDVQQNSSRAFALDADTSYPVVLVMPPKSGQAAKMVLGRMDWQQSPTCDLKMVAWDGSAWNITSIDTTSNAAFLRPKLVIDPDNRYWVWAGSGGNTIRYLYSDDRGSTWSSWTTAVTPASGENFRVAVYEDPIDPSYIYLVWANSSTSRVYMNRVKLGEFARPVPTPPAVRTIDVKAGSGSPALTKVPSTLRRGATFGKLVAQMSTLAEQSKPPRVKPHIGKKIRLKKNPFKGK